MTKTLYSVAICLFLVLSVTSSGLHAQPYFASPSAKPTTGVERRSATRSFGATQSGVQKKGEVKVPSSMDLFVDRCTEAGGGLISIDGHYDCVKPSGEPIPDW